MNEDDRVEIEGKPALSMLKAALYLGVSKTALNNKLKRYPQIKKYQFPFGQERYVLIEDLDELKKPKSL